MRERKVYTNTNHCHADLQLQLHFGSAQKKSNVKTLKNQTNILGEKIKFNWQYKQKGRTKSS